ncbi:DUF1217 domain-containing protein [Methylovirgula sp. HY1]|uniref:DUF1217 domain-containing protein n=1 Tax=Methylovirgula sp. HY1 TaxID=2822761 RepID=UPI001C5B17A2|nr:DUF1217 domain-containing protein [Methylovirgula sp. HY1]QXX74726.1 hypothetical protein MHY1_01542 [Methylovirgula sp. HY1]
MLTATILYNAIARDYTKSLANTANQPTVERSTQYFLDNIGKVTSASQLVNNSQLYNYVMSAFGLQNMSYAKALITKVLNGGAGSNSFAASLNDPRYMALVSAYDFAANGATTTSSTNSVSAATTVNNYYQQTLETQTGQENQGAQMALYFARMAPNITNPYSILADTTLLQVFQTAFNLPSSMSFESIDTQAQQVSQMLNISKLQDPTYLTQFLQRFTASYDAQNPTGGVSVAPTNALLVTSPGISSSLLLSLANLKLGGS